MKINVVHINSHYENLHGFYKITVPTIIGLFSVATNSPLIGAPLTTTFSKLWFVQNGQETTCFLNERGIISLRLLAHALHKIHNKRATSHISQEPRS